jgi:hypothetical protein
MRLADQMLNPLQFLDKAIVFARYVNRPISHCAEPASALLWQTMAPKNHHTPLSGGDRKALTKELSKSRAMTHIFAERSAEKRREGEEQLAIWRGEIH